MNAHPSPADLEALLAHREFVRAIARRLLRDKHLAEDVAQETCIAAIERPPAARGLLRGWLATVARNFARQRAREASRRAQREAASARPAAIDSAEAIAEHEALRRRVVDAVLRLDEPYRTAVWLRFYEDLSAREIAGRLGVPIATVRTRIARALERLRAQLDAQHGGDRRAWALALAPLAGRAEWMPWFAAAKEAVLVSTNAKVGISVAALALLGVAGLWWTHVQEARGGATDSSGASIAAQDAAQPARSAEPATAAGGAPAARETEASRAAAPAPRPGETSLAVRVLWGEDKTPAARVGVRILPWDAPLPHAESRWIETDAQGIARAAGIAPGRVGLYGDRGGNTTAALERGRESEATIEIPPGVDVDGSVVDANGASVARAEIWLSEYGNVVEGRIAARADASGRFRLRSVTDGHHVGARADGFAPSKQHRVAGSARTTQQLVLRLPGAGGAVEGVVLGPDGAPIEGASVLVGAERPIQLRAADGEPAAGAAACRATTDAAGRFRAAGIAPGETPVQARAPGLAPWRGAVEVAAGKTARVEARLAGSWSVSGTVRATSGALRAKTWVVAVGDGLDRSSFAGASTQTRDDGSFRLDGLAPGAAVLEVGDASMSPPLACASLRGRAGDVLRWDAVIGANGSIAGRLVDGADNPLEGWLVGARPMFAHRVSSLVVPSPARTSHAGEFEVKDLAPGLYAVSAWSPPDSATFGESPSREAAAGTRDLELRVASPAAKSAFLQGRVVDPRSAAPPRVMARIFRERVIQEQKTFTGAFRFGPLASGEWMLWLDVEGFACVVRSKTLAAGETWDLGAITLPIPGSLALRLTRDDGRPIGEGTRFNLEIAPAGTVASAPEFMEQRFRLDGQILRATPLAPGRYVLRVHGHGDGLADAEFPFEIESEKETALDVFAKTGAPRWLTFLADDGAAEFRRVHAVVRGEGDAAPLVADVHRSWDRGDCVWSLALPVGRYTVEASTDSGLHATASFAVEDLRESGASVVLRLK